MRGWRIAFVLALLTCLGLLVLWVKEPAPPPAAPVVDVPAPSSRPLAEDATPRTAEKLPVIDKPSPLRGTLRGRVIDAATGDPVREFEIGFHASRSKGWSDQGPGVRRFISQDGRFEWPSIRPDAWVVSARASGYQLFELMDLEIPEGGATGEIVIPLRRGHTLRGRVYDEATSLGIASATIRFREAGVGRFEGNWRNRPRTTTDKNGSFALEGVPSGRVTLEIHANGYAGEERTVVVDDASVLQLALSAGGTIAGRLVAADGTPVAGSVGVFNLDQGFGGSSRTTKAGEFSYPNLPAGRYQINGQSEDGIAEPQEVALGKNQRIEGLVLAVGSGRSIRGTVTGLPPDERQAVRVYLQREDGSESGAKFIDVGLDVQGAYALHGVRPGRVRVVADVSMRRRVSKSVDVPANADVTVDLVFPAGARLFGRVTRAGRPEPRVRVDAEPVAAKQPSGSAVTSQTGEYAIEGLATGEYRVHAGSHTRRVEISGDTVLDFDLSDARLSDRVLESAGKTPVVGAEVEIWPAGPKSPRIRLYERTDHFGHFALVGLEPGDFVLTVYKPGYEMLRQRISFSAPVNDMTLRIGPDPGVEMRIHDPETGRSPDTVIVIEMIDKGNGSRLQVDLDENGRGYLPGALAGSTLSVSAFGYAPATIERWNGQQLDLRFERLASR